MKRRIDANLREDSNHRLLSLGERQGEGLSLLERLSNSPRPLILTFSRREKEQKTINSIRAKFLKNSVHLSPPPAVYKQIDHDDSHFKRRNH